MTSWDYFVGFKREPEGLDAFLYKEGYGRLEGIARNYEPIGEGGLVELFYFPEVNEEDEGEPDWRSEGFQITCELMISTKDANAVPEAQRLMEKVGRSYNGILYDPGLGDYSDFSHNLN